MAKLSISKRPGDFKRVVNIPLPGGGTDQIELTLRYRTRTELAEFNDTLLKAAQTAAAELYPPAPEQGAEQLADAAAAPVEPKPLPTQAEIVASSNARGAKYILDVATGWDLAEPLDLEHAQQLVNLYTSAVSAIAEAYNRALTEVRLGN